jgi:hypothetical protein
LKLAPYGHRFNDERGFIAPPSAIAIPEKRVRTKAPRMVDELSQIVTFMDDPRAFIYAEPAPENNPDNLDERTLAEQAEEQRYRYKQMMKDSGTHSSESVKDVVQDINSKRLNRLQQIFPKKLPTELVTIIGNNANYFHKNTYPRTSKDYKQEPDYAAGYADDYFGWPRYDYYHEDFYVPDIYDEPSDYSDPVFHTNPPLIAPPPVVPRKRNLDAEDYDRHRREQRIRTELLKDQSHFQEGPPHGDEL